jgi:hypothetical protein
VISKNNEILALTQENKDLKETITSLNTMIEKLQTNEDKENDEKQEINENEDLNLVFDENKVLNKEDNTKIIQDISDNMKVLNVSVNTESNYLTLNLDKELAKLIYGYTGDGESHTITGFSQKIVDAQVLISGKTYNDLKVVMLMEDGSIKYINIENIIDESYTVKTVAESKDYVKIIKVIIKNEDNSELKYGIVGIKNDGTSTLINL